VAEGRVHVAAGLAYVDMMPVILPLARTLAGTVRDGTGKALPGVRVEARDWLIQSGLFGMGGVTWSVANEPRTGVRTDSKGRFVLTSTCESAIGLRVGGEGFTTEWIGPLAAGESFDAVIERAPIVTVRVIDAAGKAMGGVLVGYSGQQQRDSNSGCTDGAGCWSFTWNGEHPVDVVARDQQYRELGRIGLAAPKTHVDLVVAGNALLQDVAPVSEPATLEPGTVAVRGRVVDPDGSKPVTSAWVRAVSRDEASEADSFVLDGYARGRPDAVRTGPDGTFVLHLKPGPHWLVAAEANVGPNWRMHGRERNPTPLSIEVSAAADTAPIDLMLQPLVSCRGSVGGTRLPRGCMVQFVPDRQHSSSADDYDFSQRFVLAADGSFSADGLLARRYLVKLLVPRGGRQGLPDRIPLSVVDVAAGANLRLDATNALPAIVHGKVRGNVPSTRLAVLSLPANDDRAALFGCLHYWGPVCPVQRDGSYRISEAPGMRALLVVDLASGVVLAREPMHAVEPGRDREQDIEVTALPLDVEARGAPAGAVQWLDLVVSGANWPVGLGQMVDLGDNRHECGLGVVLRPGTAPMRLWLPRGTTRLVWRTEHVVKDGSEILADVKVDPATQDHVVLEVSPRASDPGK